MQPVAVKMTQCSHIPQLFYVMRAKDDMILAAFSVNCVVNVIKDFEVFRVFIHCSAIHQDVGRAG